MSDCDFVFFWDLCLKNLPDGQFEKPELMAEDATAMIHATVSAGSTVWVGSEDLPAPYNHKVRRRHKEPCSVLRSEHGWPLDLTDLLSALDGDPQFATTRPLVLTEVSPKGHLLIVSCCYEFDNQPDKKNTPETLFTMAHDTMTFYLTEQADCDTQSTGGRPAAQ